jgi:predicted metal-dependent phosphoesterase TrpH
VKTIRVAPHVHSEWSYDAEWPLAELVDAFRERKYDAILTAEHDRGFDGARWDAYRQACAGASTDDLLIVPGMEYEDAESLVHVPVWGEEVPFLGAARPTEELLRDAKANDCFTVYAHPTRRNAIDAFRPKWAELLDAVEIWNRHYDGIAPYPRGREFASEQSLRPFVALDFHTRRQFFPLALLLEVEEPITAATVVQALRSGRFRIEAFGRDASRFTNGLPGSTLRTAERLRKRVRGPVRRAQRLLGRD